jgi:hypothetical protein
MEELVKEPASATTLAFAPSVSTATTARCELRLAKTDPAKTGHSASTTREAQPDTFANAPRVSRVSTVTLKSIPAERLLAQMERRVL